jgi:diguanylate cyclase (GGDEF)-like protein/PAS domain S-box-containing protein
MMAAPIALILAVSLISAGYSLDNVGTATSNAESQSVATRQIASLERYASDVYLALAGDTRVSPGDTADVLRATAAAMLGGGTVEAFQGSGHEQLTVDAVPAGDIRLKFQQSELLIDRLVLDGAALIASEPDTAARTQLLDSFRVHVAALDSNMNDAAGSLTVALVNDANREATSHLVLSLCSLLVTIFAGLCCWLAAGRIADRRYRALVDQASDLVLITDTAWTIGFASESAQRLVGVGANELVGTCLFDWIGEGDEAVLTESFGTVGRSQPKVIEHQFRCGDGSIAVLESAISNLLHVPGVNGIVINAHDITDRKRLEAELTKQAFEDGLTALPNRALLMDRLDHALERTTRTAESIALLFVDLDGFKLINDGCGHLVGDAALVEVAERLRSCVRTGDTVARLGSDEFAVVMENVASSAEAQATCDRILHALRAPIRIGETEMVATASIGVVHCEGGRANAFDLLRDADVAMCRAKAQGRNRFVVFDESMRTAAAEVQHMATALRRDIDSNSVTLVFQPIVDLATGRLVAAEALVRWNSAAFGAVPPTKFVRIAEDCGLIDVLGEWVLRQACVDALTWPDGPSGAIGVNVNVSILQLRDGRFPDLVCRVLTETGLPAQRLTIELTESAFMNTSAVLPILADLRALGVRIAIDDFGTGYSTLGMLAELPVDIIKIDKTFVDRLERHDGTAVVRSIIEMVSALGLTATAEGVENDEQRRLLTTLQCHTMQGYVYSKPTTTESIRRLAEANSAPAGESSALPLLALQT